MHNGVNIQAKKNEATATSSSMQSISSTSRFIHQDNRAKSVVQQKQVEAFSLKKNNGSVPPVLQRKISFAIGKQTTFKDIPHLKKALKAMYAKKHHAEIETLVDDAESKKFTVGAVDTFNQINSIAARDEWTRNVQALPTGGHGPSLPVLDSHHVDEDKESAMSTFMFGSVTLGKAQLILPNKTTVTFEARQSGSTEHAEDLLMAKIDYYLNSKDINPKQCQVRITINNAPCGTASGEKNCAGALAKYQGKKKFGRFRIYFMNSYGATMTTSVKGMQKAKIKVSHFSPKELNLDSDDYKETTWSKIQEHEKIAPSGFDLDEWSDDSSSESSSSSESETEKKSARKTSRSRSPRGRKTEKKSARKPSRSRSPEEREEESKRSKKVVAKKTGEEGKQEKSRSRSRSPRGERRKEERAERRKGRSDQRGDVPYFRPSRYKSLDGIELFDDIGDQLTMGGAVAFTGYQVAALVRLFGGEPVGKIVTVNDGEFKIVKLVRSLAKTQYNPTGLALGLIRFLRGG
jgi:hypothetical protein